MSQACTLIRRAEEQIEDRSAESKRLIDFLAKVWWQGDDLGRAKRQSDVLSGADMQNDILSGAGLQGNVLSGAEM